MAKATYICRGEVAEYTPKDNDIERGDVIKFAGVVGVATDNCKKGGVVAVSICGVYEIPAETTAAFTLGDTLYWNGTALTKTEPGNVKAGICMGDKAQASATALVKIG